MRPHSADLRRRIVTLYERGEGSIRQLAKRFQVSQDSVRCLIKQYRASGSIAPKPYAGGPQPTLQATHHEVLRELVEADNDATLAQLAQRLATRTGTKDASGGFALLLSPLACSKPSHPYPKYTHPSLSIG